MLWFLRGEELNVPQKGFPPCPIPLTTPPPPKTKGVACPPRYVCPYVAFLSVDFCDDLIHPSIAAKLHLTKPVPRFRATKLGPEAPLSRIQISPADRNFGDRRRGWGRPAGADPDRRKRQWWTTRTARMALPRRAAQLLGRQQEQQRPHKQILAERTSPLESSHPKPTRIRRQNRTWTARRGRRETRRQMRRAASPSR